MKQRQNINLQSKSSFPSKQSSKNILNGKRQTRTKSNLIVDTSFVPKNSNGGVLVKEDDLKSFFQFVDAEGSGKLTVANMKKRLGIFDKNLTTKECRLMLNGRSELALQELRDLLLGNSVTNFDPVGDAFQKIFDKQGSGFADIGSVREIFQKMKGNAGELGELGDEDLRILIDTADLDRDGRIGLNDFRALATS